MPADAYADAIRPAVPRLVSLLDRDPTSPTYGCFDRLWWSWKFTDMPAPRLQEGVLCLALLADLDVPSSPLAGQARVWTWVAAGLDFLATLQHRSGCFDEAYPYERSWGATAFLGAAVARTVEVAGDRLDTAARTRALDLAVRAGRWLADHDETHGFLANHRAAAADALVTTGELAGDAALRRAGAALVDGIVAAGSPEGWFPEYGGADPGYQSHALGYLARICRRTGRHADVLDRAAGFLGLFLGKDGGFGGETGARDTSFLFPGGIEALASDSPHAAALAHGVREAVAARRLTGLDAMDDRNLMPMLASYLTAAHAAARGTALGPAPLPRDVPGTRWLPDAGLLVHTTPRYHAVVAVRKGGVVVATGADGTAFVDGGWADARHTTQLPRTGPVAGPGADGVVVVRAPVGRRRHAVFGPASFVAFRASSAVAAAVPRASTVVKHALVRRLVTGRASGRGHLERVVQLDDEGITLRDTVVDAPATLAPVERTAAIHMGSGRYHQPRELLPAPPVDVVDDRGWPRRTRTVRVRFGTGEGSHD